MQKAGPILVLLLLLPAASGAVVQAEVFTDDDGDVILSTQDGSAQQPDPTGTYKNVDIIAGGIWAEDDDTVTFYVQVDDLTKDSQVLVPFSDPDYYLYFKHGDQGYRIFVATALENPTNGAFGRDGTTIARLERQVDEYRYSGLADAEVEMDFSDELVLISVPRAALVDDNQAPLARNATLTDFFIEGRSMGWFGFPIPLGGPGGSSAFVGIPQAYDRGPDNDFGSYQMTTGSIQQKGSIFAVSNDPVRWTNGEATTLKFEVKVTNLGSSDISTKVNLREVDASWDVAFVDRLSVPARGDVNTTILVSIPFSHQHGETQLFEAHFASDDGANQATAMLGIHWPEVPQPAGHHNRLWLHGVDDEVMPPFDSIFASTHGWFSAKQDIDGDDGTMIIPDFTITPGMFGAQEGRALWYLRLEPGLRMGLDFRPGETSQMELGFNFPFPAIDPQVTVSLVHSVTFDSPGRGGIGGGGGGGGSTVDTLLMFGQSETQAGSISGGADFEIELLMADGVDNIPYDPDANLLLIVDLEATFLLGTGFMGSEAVIPTLDPSTSTFDLPLNEYHDPANLSFNTDASVQIIVGQTQQERLVNPGRTVVYEFELDFMGDAATTFEASLSGRNVEWGEIIGDVEFDLEAGTKRPLAIAVTAPDEAKDGEQADITLTVRSTSNAAIQSGVQTLTTVTSTQDIPDEAEQKKALAGELTKEKEAPALGVALLALAIISLAYRRRQN